jgi:HAD superfamily hydrolase (TIGR01509 family)
MARVPALKALLWDVDGTLAETERDGHLQAFNQALAKLGVPWRWSEARYGELLRITGGRERLLHDMQSQPQAPQGQQERVALVEAIHREKNALYADIIAAGTVPLRAGVRDLIVDCAAAGLSMGIVTTTSASNVEALVSAHFGMYWQSLFAVVVCAEDAPKKKPDPLAYRIALARLGLEPYECLAVEDSPAGVAAAGGCGVPVIVTRSHYFGARTLQGAVAIGDSLGDSSGWQPAARYGAPRIDLAQVTRWHAEEARPSRRFSRSG